MKRYRRPLWSFLLYGLHCLLSCSCGYFNIWPSCFFSSFPGQCQGDIGPRSEGKVGKVVWRAYPSRISGYGPYLWPWPCRPSLLTASVWAKGFSVVHEGPISSSFSVVSTCYPDTTPHRYQHPPFLISCAFSPAICPDGEHDFWGQTSWVWALALPLTSWAILGLTFFICKRERVLICLSQSCMWSIWNNFWHIVSACTHNSTK